MLTRLMKAPEKTVVSLVGESAECSFGILPITRLLLTRPIQGYWRIGSLRRKVLLSRKHVRGFRSRHHTPLTFGCPSMASALHYFALRAPLLLRSHDNALKRPLTSMPIDHHLARLHRLPPRPQMKHLPRLQAPLEALLRRSGNDLGRILGLPSVADALEQQLLRGCAACPEFVGDIVGCETGANGRHGWLAGWLAGWEP